MIPDIHRLLRLGKSPVKAPRLTLRAAVLADTASQILTGALRGVAHFRDVLSLVFHAFSRLSQPGNAFCIFSRGRTSALPIRVSSVQPVN
jgi:hypothetical protein